MFNTEKIEKLDERVNSLDTRIEILSEHKIQCDLQHADHVEHRRRLYDILDEALVYLKNISNILEENKPTINRSKNNFTTIDTLRNWAIWLTAMLTCIASMTAIFHILRVI